MPSPRARRQSSRLSAVSVLLMISLLAFRTSVAAGGIAIVSQTADAGSRTLLAALQDPTVQDVVVLPPLYNVRSEFESTQGKPIALNRCAGPRRQPVGAGAALAAAAYRNHFKYSLL
jgi:hypothetical protein